MESPASSGEDQPCLDQSAVMLPLYGTVVVKEGASRKTKFLIYRSIDVPTLPYGHEIYLFLHWLSCLSCPVLGAVPLFQIHYSDILIEL